MPGQFDAIAQHVAAHAPAPNNVRQLREGVTPPASIQRDALHVSSTADMVEWLHQTLGTAELAGMFNRGGSLVYCPQITAEGYAAPDDDDERDDLKLVDSSTLASRIQLLRWCFKMVENDKGEKVPVATMFPKSAATVMTDAPDMQPNLRKLRSVVSTPTVRADGTILDTPGYDAATQMIYRPAPGLVVPSVPEEPDEHQLGLAVNLIVGTMLKDYAWGSKHDQANYVGMMLTPLLRAICPGPYKLGIIQARVRGSGKSYLAEGLRTLHDGEVRGDIPQADEEFRKQVTSILMDSTGAVMTWDNIQGRLQCAGLDALLTARTWSDRVLGLNKNVRIPNDRLWTVTGNNVRIGGDLVRRVLPVLIDPKMAKPWTRTEFDIPDWPTWVREQRGLILWSLLVMIRAWVVAGRVVPKASSADSYGVWVQTINGILAHTRTVLAWRGVQGEFDHPDTHLAEGSEDDTDLGEFIDAVRETFGTEPWTTKELLKRVKAGPTTVSYNGVALPEQPPTFPIEALPGDMGEQAAKAYNVVASLTRRLGGWLKAHQGQYANGWAVEAGDKGNSGVRWRLVAEPGLS